MASAIKTLVATGASSGIGLDLIRQVIAQPTPWSIHLAARSPSSVAAALASFPRGSSSTTVTPHPIDLVDLSTVRSFAQTTLAALGDAKLDYLLLNAAMLGGEPQPPRQGATYSDGWTVNHLSQHYLVHLLRDKLVASGTRIIFVSSGAVRNVPDPTVIDEDRKAGSETSVSDPWKHYAQTKFAALVSANWWRRELLGKCVVVAVSPGLIHGSGLGRSVDFKPAADHPDAKTVEEGAASVYAALIRDDLPEDPEQLFLTSWGEWWPKDVYAKSLDRALWDRWCPDKAEIEREAGIAR